MSKMILIPLFFTLMNGSTGLAAKSSGSSKDVEQTLASYREKRTFKAKVKKTITQELLGGTPNLSEGEFYFSKGRLRLEIEKPEPTILVFDGKYIWFESRIDDKVVVTKMKSQEIKKSDSLLAVLFDRKDILKSFKLTKTKSDGDAKQFSFVPKDPKKSEVQTLDLTILPKSKEIRKISYTDTVENKVELEFSDTQKSDVPKAKFQYKPPKGADITEL